MGNIKEAVKKDIPYGATCQCPCKSGIAADSTVDALVVAAVSNWGAYGIASCLAALTKNLNAFHNGKIERRILENISNQGAIDGVTCLTEDSVDGLSSEINVYVVEMLREIVKKVS